MSRPEKYIKYVGDALFMLLVFLFVADPTNTILGMKNGVFALLFLYSIIFFKADWSKLIYFFIPVVAVTVSWLFAIMQGHNFFMFEIKAVYTAFIPLLLLPWSAHYDMMRLSIPPIVLTTIIILALFWVIFFMPEVEGPVYHFMGSHADTIMMSNRSFLGVMIFCMYPKSITSFMTVYGLVAYNSFTKKKSILYIVIMLLMSHLFLISGTRSSMLLPIFLLFVIYFIYCRNGRYVKYIVYPLVFIFVIAFVILLAMLLMETDEPSNMVKYAHVRSFIDLFMENPEYLLFGQGPGTKFYTEGFRVMAMKTEWTYLELLRNYGIMSIPILYVIMSPAISLFKLARKHDSAIAVSISYIIYLIIAGTNPLLLSSVGMLILLTGYSYVEKLKKNDANQKF